MDVEVTRVNCTWEVIFCTSSKHIHGWRFILSTEPSWCCDCQTLCALFAGGCMGPRAILGFLPWENSFLWRKLSPVIHSNATHYGGNRTYTVEWHEDPYGDTSSMKPRDIYQQPLILRTAFTNLISVLISILKSIICQDKTCDKICQERDLLAELDLDTFNLFQISTWRWPLDGRNM